MKRASFFSGTVLLSALLLAGYSGPALAGVPLKINFQGRLDESGQPVDGTKTFVFRIYDVSSGGTPLWVSQPQTIGVAKGVFSAELSAGTLSDLSTPSNISTATFSGPRYVEIVVNGQALSPYQEMASAPYALVAQALSPDAQLPASSIADGSVTDVKVTLSTAAISSGKFSDDRVQITTGAFTGGFNGADQLVRLDASKKLPAADGSQLYKVSVTTAELSGAITDTAVQLSTGAISSGRFGDDRVAITTAALSGTLTDVSVSITTGAITSGKFGDDRVNITTGAVTSGKFSDDRVNITTGAVTSGKFSDDRVNITTGAVTSGKFGDDRVQITTGAFTGGFNSAGQLVQLNGGGNLAINGGVSAASLLVSGALAAGGSLTLPVKVVTSTYTATANDVTLIINSTASGSITVELPSAVGIAGRIYIVKCISTNGAAYDYVAPYGTETIDAGTYDAVNRYPLSINNSVVLQSDGADWIIITYS